MERKLKKNKDIGAGFVSAGRGITLVALVITIIILLILSGITLGFVFRNNGIIGMAQKAGKNYMDAEKEESNTLEKLYSSMLVATNDDSKITVSVQELRVIIQEEIRKTGGTGPTGTIISYMGNTAPDGYLPCDGATYNIADYPNLSTQIQEQFGSYSYFGGDGENTFAVPNLSGEFLRGSGTQGYGTAVAVGKHQNATWHDMIGVYYNTSSDYWVGGFATGIGYSTNREQDLNGGSSKTFVFARTGTNESQGFKGQPTMYTSRPTNTTVLYCIKY